jgi:O-acetylserine/cysteine efflux transporter
VGGAMVLGGVLIVALRAIAKSRTLPASETP